jgi:hypothetical protein
MAAGGHRPSARFGLHAAGAFGAALIAIGDGQALASAGCDAVNAGGFNQTVVGESEGATIADFAIGDTVTFVFNNGGGFSDLTTGNGTTLAAFGDGLHTVSHTITGANADTTLTDTIASAGPPISFTATCTPAAASQD